MEDLNRKRKRQREWVAKRRKNWFAANGPCRGCGSSENLEMHHIDRTEKEEHRIFSWSKARREVELVKCVVLFCAQCKCLNDSPNSMSRAAWGIQVALYDRCGICAKLADHSCCAPEKDHVDCSDVNPFWRWNAVSACGGNPSYRSASY